MTITPPRPAETRSPRLWPWAVGSVIVTVIALFGVVLVFGGDARPAEVDPVTAPTPEEHSPELDLAAAELACQDFVRDRLKAPATAEFTEAVTAPLAGYDRYTVSGAVDAQNSFGALIRNFYSCTVGLSTSGDRWFLQSLDLGRS